MRFVVLCACEQILGLCNKLRKTDVLIYFNCKYGLLQICPGASGAHPDFDSAAYPPPGLLDDPVFAIITLSQRIGLLRILAFAYHTMILSGISVNTKVSKDERYLLMVDAARTAAVPCSRLTSGSEQLFSLNLASKAGFGWPTSSKHRLVSPWLCVPGEK